ncbi:hypothetical protein C9374_013189 [Naegleria lovaniensis]|uniref:Uncharacterized protein n=1 Tax=Naegleria lovaniensis TaxID=51637 RepID=A0AA88G6B1_NAELO|nr:uncharacterized protein C9374_013189 [Naegleria lovaniensis]KAG2372737.1 hypothetical protein C9374_013189 [Naegleria lovaniensis]
MPFLSFKLSRNSKQQVDDDLSHLDSTKKNSTSSETADVVIGNKEFTVNGFVSIPSELLLHMAQYIGSLKDLLSFASCHSILLQLLFNQNRKLKSSPHNVVQISEQTLEMHFGVSTNHELNSQLLSDENDLFQATQQQVWKSLVCYYFPNFEKSLNVKNWMHVLKRRIQHLKLYTPHLLPLKPQISSKPFKVVSRQTSTPKGDELFIENCEWIYKCPLKYEELNEGPHVIKGSSHSLPKVQFCSVCSKNVYLVRNQVDLKDHVMKGNCVAFTSESLLLSLPSPQVMGSMVYIPPNAHFSTDIRASPKRSYK